MLFAVRLSLCLAGFTLSLTACTGGSSSQSSSQNSGHLYAANLDQSGNPEILLFPLPLTGNAAPSLTATGSAGLVIAVDASGDIAVLDGQCHLTIYNAPISNPLKASATFSNGANCTPNVIAGLTFSSSGDLFVTTGGSQINVFAHPFSSASTVAQTITVPALTPRDVALDSSGNLYVAAAGFGASCAFISNALYAFAPPYTGSPTVSSSPCGDFAFFSVVASRSQLFVSRDSGNVTVSTLGGGGGFDITTKINVGSWLAVDGSGNLYLNDGQIHVYTGPVSSSTVPSATLSVSVGSIAIGP